MLKKQCRMDIANWIVKLIVALDFICYRQQLLVVKNSVKKNVMIVDETLIVATIGERVPVPHHDDVAARVPSARSVVQVARDEEITGVNDVAVVRGVEVAIVAQVALVKDGEKEIFTRVHSQATFLRFY